MNNKTYSNTSVPLTREVLQEELDKQLNEKLKDYPTKVEMGVAFESFRSAVRGDMEELLTQFRSDMYTRFDQIVGENAQIRED